MPIKKGSLAVLEMRLFSLSSSILHSRAVQVYRVSVLFFFPIRDQVQKGVRARTNWCMLVSFLCSFSQLSHHPALSMIITIFCQKKEKQVHRSEILFFLGPRSPWEMGGKTRKIKTDIAYLDLPSVKYENSTPYRSFGMLSTLAGRVITRSLAKQKCEKQGKNWDKDKAARESPSIITREKCHVNFQKVFIGGLWETTIKI